MILNWFLINQNKQKASINCDLNYSPNNGHIGARMAKWDYIRTTLCIFFLEEKVIYTAKSYFSFNLFKVFILLQHLVLL